jgi:PAS domain-containing protein
LPSSRTPPPEDVDRVRSELQRQRNRLQLLARDGGSEAVAAAVDELSEQLLVADEELKVQNEQLEQSTRRLDLLVAVHEQLFSDAPTPYLQTDSDGLILRHNRAARDLLNLPSVANRSRTLVSLVRPVDRPAVRDLLSKVRIGRAGEPFENRPPRVEVVVRTADDRLVPVVASVRRSSDAGTGRALLHWELQPGTTPPAEPAEPARGVHWPAQIRALADAATEIAGQSTPALALEHVVGRAQRAIPGCEEAGIMLVRAHGRIETPAATGELAMACDQLQYDLGEGPCLGAIDDSRPVLVADLAGERRWPRFVVRARELGVASMLALPLAAPRGVLGALNLYATVPRAFDEADELVGQAFATHAGIALAHAEMETNLRIGLATREEIGRAVGILMERHRVTATAAFDMLVVASQRSHLKLRAVAAWMNETGEDPMSLVRGRRPEA